MTPQPLASHSQVANSSGRAICQVQPLRAFEGWHLTSVSVQSTSDTLIPMAKLYRSSEYPTNFIEGTDDARFNTTADPIDLVSGERLLAVFENCDVGSTCTLVVIGEKVGR